MQKVAFFDIDGTVFRSSLFIELVEGCITEGIFPAEAKLGYQKEYDSWRNRDGSYETYIDAVVATFMKHIKGVFYGDFADIGRKVVKEQGRQTYRYTRDLIQDLRGKGYYIVAISQSPKTILDEFCAGYGFDKVYGRIYELGPRDLFTGEVAELELIKNKSLVIERVLEREGLTLEDSIGVGDTEGDIQLLESVETPICFNPNMSLYAYAQKKKWPVVVERKDVVYTL
ncbi:MAG: HAD-IB family phosphatase [Candidatus Pacebacteria bacterium]|nr:HAD-IB family phosphatase [Candidatus Paceibacterota bacterium]MCF7857531.1 HAD-IB family phosphatase [Candidatus Paceibacterota bacterium]